MNQSFHFSEGVFAPLSIDFLLELSSLILYFLYILKHEMIFFLPQVILLVMDLT